MTDRTSSGPPVEGGATAESAPLGPAAVRAVGQGSGETRLAAILDALDPMIWSTGPDGSHDYRNARWHEFTGVPPSPTDGEAWTALLHPEDQEGAQAAWDRSLATGEALRLDGRLRHRSGQHRWVAVRARPSRDGDGRITGWSGTVTDIHDERAEKEVRGLVAEEMAHRIKNLFALVSGLVALSARGEPGLKPFAAVVQARILALARAQDLVGAGGPPGPAAATRTLRELLEILLAPYRTGHRVRVECDDADPRPVVGPVAATALSLILHELGTNAIKHGALALERGGVVVAGRRLGDAMVVTWAEHGGRAVEAPTGPGGFGLGMAQRVARLQLDADLRCEWSQDGLTAWIAVPMTRLGQ